MGSGGGGAEPPGRLSIGLRLGLPPMWYPYSKTYPFEFLPIINNRQYLTDSYGECERLVNDHMTHSDDDHNAVIMIFKFKMANIANHVKQWYSFIIVVIVNYYTV